MRIKKALLYILALMLTVAAASPALAIDWSAQGAINIMAAYYKNVDLRIPTYLGGPPGMHDFGFGVGAAEPAWNRDNFWLQERMELFITARSSPDLYGVIGFEIDSIRFGEQDAMYIPATASAGLGKYIAGRWNAAALA